MGVIDRNNNSRVLVQEINVKEYKKTTKSPIKEE